MTDHSSIGHFTLRALLGAHSDELVGAAPEPTDDEVGFTVDRLRHGGSIVTMLETCDLSFVFARCREVSNAILDQGEDTVTFTRDEDRAASRLAELRAMRGRWRTTRPQGADGLDLRHCLDAALAKQEVTTAQRAMGRISVADLVSAQSTALLGPRCKGNPDFDPQPSKSPSCPTTKLL
jgi:hypothetical protein